MSEQKVEKIPGNAGISPDGFFAVQLSLVEKYAQYLSHLPKEDLKCFESLRHRH